MATSDTDTIFDDKPMHGGEYGLWLRVTTDAVVSLLKYRGSNIARDFLFDESNTFFQLVCDELGYDPAALRERIKESVQRAGKDRREPWQDRIRGTVTETEIIQPGRSS